MKQYLFGITFFTLIFSAHAQVNTIGRTSAEAKTPWPKVQPQMRPWTRWWWMGNAVDEKNLATALLTYSKAGLGGVEITPIYGARGYEDRYIDFLSPKWMQMLDFTVKKARQLNMGLDMNTGTGWPFGGPQITPAFAASKLIVQRYRLVKGQYLNEAIVLNDGLHNKDGVVLQAVAAYGTKGEVINLTDQVDAAGLLKWQSQQDDYELYALFLGKTGQKVKRAAPAGEGYTLDHLNKTAVDVYLQRFDLAFASKPVGVRSFFNDSYEVYGANWAPGFLKAFKRINGYDLSLHIKELTDKDSTNTRIGRLKSDYRETMNALLLQNFTVNWTNWAHGHQSKTRNQSHGSPGNLLDLYAAVDIPETETFGSSYFPIPGLRRDSGDIRNVDPDPIMSKFASSATHTKGGTLVSSETFTWLTEHFKTAFSQAKPEAEQLFLAGVNHLFYHGTTYTPSDVPFPGWLFYAAMNVVPANSLWPQLKGMNDYFSRCQSILQTGKSDNELLVYWPIYDQWSNPKGLDMPMKVHDIDQWLQPTAFYKQSKLLDGAGYAIDFASDVVIANSTVTNGKVITAATASPYQTLVIPECALMPLPTLRQILSLAKSGATVIFQALPLDVPGLADLEKRRAEFRALIASLKFNTASKRFQQLSLGKGKVLLSADLQQALTDQKIEGEQLVKTGLKFIRRKWNNGTYYYLVNHTAKTIDEWIPLNQAGQYLTLLDPQSGDFGRVPGHVKGGKVNLKVHLQPGETIFVYAAVQKNKEIGPVKNWLYLSKPGKPIALNQNWQLRFTAGGPVLPRLKKLKQLVSWTELNDPEAIAFSGTGEYTTTFILPATSHKEYILDLGKVNESAHVWINEKDAGIFWSIPYQRRVGKYLKAGKNTIRIEVVNLMANRIRDMDQSGIKWRNYHEINFVNIDYKPFDASKWEPMSSGLIGPVTITGYN